MTERFWSHVARASDDECWPWTAKVNRKGYGQLNRKRRTLYAHRVAWELTNGPIPEGLWVLHRCDNPPCCNPAHLFLGDHAINMADARAKGRMRGNPGKGGRRFTLVGPKITRKAAEAIRARYIAGRETQAEIARAFGIEQRTVSHIVRGTRWPDPDYTPPPRRYRCRSVNSRHANVSPVSVAAATEE